MHARNLPLNTERTPSHMCWINDTTLVLTDSIASAWIYRFDASPVADRASITLIYRGRLLHRATFFVRPTKEPESFLVGHKDICVRYTIILKNGSCRLQGVATSCLGYGRVQQVLSAPGRKEYLCCTNTTASIIDEAGNVVSLLAHNVIAERSGFSEL